MRRLVKILLALVGAVLVLIIAVCIIVVLSINAVARRGVEAGGTYALGVPTTLKGASIGILGGTVQLQGLHVSNAPGFPTDHFLTLGDAKVAVKLSSLTSDTIYIPELTLDSIDVALEKKEGKSNYDVILGNLQKLSGPPDTTKPPPPKEGGKKLVIHELTIRRVNVHADLLGGPGVIGAATRVSVPLDEIKLKDVGQTGTGAAGTGVTIGELSGLVVQAVLAAAVEKGGLPADFAGDLKGHIAKLGDLAGGAGKQVAAQAESAAKQLQQEAGKLAEQIGGPAGDQIKKEAEKLGGGLKGLIPKSGEKKK